MSEIRERNVRSVAVSAERHWWVSKLRHLAYQLEHVCDRCPSCGSFDGKHSAVAADALRTLIAEREL
jgi:hypothetical protein